MPAVNDPLPSADPDRTAVREPSDPDSTLDRTADSTRPPLPDVSSETAGPRGAGNADAVRGPDASGRAVSAALDPPPGSPAIPGYRITGEIAKGGMGRVYAAADLTLDREVAIKTLLPGANADRFVTESKITAKLPHPNIPPVYELGELADGTPFLAMKLIRGETLSALVKARPSPRHDLPRWVQVFEGIAQAVGFAHSRGVIHRDLKPLNVMVGEFGEVQVMDWGLARVLAPLSPGGEGLGVRGTGEAVTPGGDASHTQAGTIMGTPAYMAPEQARGEPVDARADVFALGAMLAVVLTGRPAFGGTSVGETIQKAAKAELSDVLARLDACGADADLIALAKRCLSADRDARPPDGRVVATEVAAYRAGVEARLKQAETERAEAVVREGEQRKRRRVQVLLIAAVAVLVMGGVSVAWWQTDQDAARRDAALRQQVADEQRATADAARLARNGEAVAGLLAQAEVALRAGDADRAAVVLDAALKRSAEGGAESDADRFKRLAEDLALARELDAVDQFRWTVVENKLPDPAEVARRTRVVLARFGADPDAASVDDAVARVTASVVRERIVSALDRVLLQERTAGVRDLLRRVDADAYRDAVRDAVRANDGVQVAQLAGRKAAREQPPGFITFLGDSPSISLGQRRQLMVSAAIQKSGDLNLLMTLAGTYWGPKEQVYEEAVRWYQAAVAAAPDNCVARYDLGVALMSKGQWDEGIACLKKAIELVPQYAPAHGALGGALVFKGQWDEGVACLKKAVELDPKNAVAHYNLGGALMSRGRWDEAIVCLEMAVEFDPKFAGAHTVLGGALLAKGQVDEAITCFKKIVELDPKNAKAHSDLGSMLTSMSRWDEAIACYRKAVELDPKNANTHFNLGNALAGKGRWDEAIACYKKAVELDPKNAEAFVGLSRVLVGKDQLDEAIACLKQAVELDPKNTETHAFLCIMLLSKSRWEEAIVCYRKLLELDPKNADARQNLAFVQQMEAQGKKTNRVSVGVVFSDGNDIAARVVVVNTDGPAGKGGVKVGDTITKFNGDEVASAKAFRQLLTGKKSGDVVKLTVRRGGETVTLSVTLSEK